MQMNRAIESANPRQEISTKSLPTIKTTIAPQDPSNAAKLEEMAPKARINPRIHLKSINSAPTPVSPATIFGSTPIPLNRAIAEKALGKNLAQLSKSDSNVPIPLSYAEKKTILISQLQSISTASKPILQKDQPEDQPKVKGMKTINAFKANEFTSEKVKPLGEGAFKLTYFTQLNSGKTVVVAVVNPVTRIPAAEIFALKALNEAKADGHDLSGVLKFYGSLKIPDSKEEVLVTKICNQGDLKGFWGKASPEQRREILKQSGDGTSNLGAAGFTHRDIKSSNLLIDVNKENKVQVVLGDLGTVYRSGVFPAGEWRPPTNTTIMDPKSYFEFKNSGHEKIDSLWTDIDSLLKRINVQDKKIRDLENLISENKAADPPKDTQDLEASLSKLVVSRKKNEDLKEGKSKEYNELLVVQNAVPVHSASDPQSDVYAHGLLICDLVRKEIPYAEIDLDPRTKDGRNSRAVSNYSKTMTWFSNPNLSVEDQKKCVAKFITETPFESLDCCTEKQQDELKELVTRMMAYEPNDRPSKEEVKNRLHEIFGSEKAETLEVKKAPAPKTKDNKPSSSDVKEGGGYTDTAVTKSNRTSSASRSSSESSSDSGEDVEEGENSSKEGAYTGVAERNRSSSSSGSDEDVEEGENSSTDGGGYTDVAKKSRSTSSSGSDEDVEEGENSRTDGGGYTDVAKKSRSTSSTSSDDDS